MSVGLRVVLYAGVVLVIALVGWTVLNVVSSYEARQEKKEERDSRFVTCFKTKDTIRDCRVV